MNVSHRELLYRALLVFGAVAAVFIAGEAGLRVLYSMDRSRGGTLQEKLERSRASSLEESGGEHSIGGLVQASPYRDVVYELKPGLRGSFRQRPVSISSLGLRDREYTREKPQGTFRIVGVGDSVMFGWGVLEEETFLAVLERWLEDLPSPPDRYEVLNFAAPGYNTAIEVALLEQKALPLQPDLLIIHHVSNDWGVPTFMQRKPDPLSLKRSYFLDLLRARLASVTLERRQRLVGYRFDEVATDEEKEEIRSRYQHMVGVRGYRRSMDRLGRLAREEGIPVMVLIGSTRGSQMRRIQAQVKEQGFHSVSIGPVTDRILAQYGIPNEDRVLRRKLQVAPGDPHPNAFGHYIYALGLWEGLQEAGIIPPAATPVFPASSIP